MADRRSTVRARRFGRRGRVGPFVLAAAMIAASCTPDVPQEPTIRIDSLSVRLLPRGTSADIVVSGDGFSPSTAVTVDAGLTATTVVYRNSRTLEVTVTDTGADPIAALDLTVVDGTRTATCDGCLRILGSRLAPPSSSVRSATTSGSTTTLTLDGAQGGLATAPTRGDVIGVGVTAATPSGLLGRVTAVRGDGSSLVLDLTPVPLIDLAPSGRVQSSGQMAAVATAPAARAPGSALVNSSSFQPFAEQVSCTAGGSMSIAGSIDISSTFDFDLEWDDDSDAIAAASVSATATETLTIDGEVTGTASCELDDVELLPAPIRFAPRVVFVGVVPVVLIPTLQLYLSADAAASGAVTMGLTQQFSATAGIRYADGNVTPIAGHDITFAEQEPTVEASATAGISVSARLGLVISGIDGPTVNLDGDLGFSADVDATPCWSLTGGLQAGASLDIPLTDFTIGRSDLIRYERTVAEDDGTSGICPPPPTTTTTTTPGGSTTTTSTPGEDDCQYCRVGTVSGTYHEVWNNAELVGWGRGGVRSDGSGFYEGQETLTRYNPSSEFPSCRQVSTYDSEGVMEQEGVHLWTWFAYAVDDDLRVEGISARGPVDTLILRRDEVLDCFTTRDDSAYVPNSGTIMSRSCPGVDHGQLAMGPDLNLRGTISAAATCTYQDQSSLYSGGFGEFIEGTSTYTVNVRVNV